MGTRVGHGGQSVHERKAAVSRSSLIASASDLRPTTQPPKLTRRRRAKTVAMAPHFFGMLAVAAIILAIIAGKSGAWEGRFDGRLRRPKP